MIINGIDFKVIINIKRIKNINIRFKNIDKTNYLVVNSYKKLSENEIEELLKRNEKAVNRLIKKMVINPLNDDQFLIFGHICSRTQEKELTEIAFLEVTKMFNYYKIVFKNENCNLIFKKMKSRWGVCYLQKNSISLTKSIIHVPKHLVEYVIIHEFCHFTYPNHSKQFYALVSKYCQDYKKRIKELKNFSYVLI